MAFERPGAEGRVSAQEAGAGQAVGIAVDGGADQHAQREGAGQVHGKRAEGEVAPKPAGNRAVEDEAHQSAGAAGQAEPDQHRRCHAVSLARRTRLVASATARKPAATLAEA